MTRVVFPLWLCAGAVAKLLDGSPLRLPMVLIKGLGAMGVDLMFVLHFSIGVELAIVGLVLILARLARPLSLLMLGVFFPILAGDMLLGAATCGCFGAIEVPPLVTMVFDVGLFVGILLLGRKAESLAVTPTLRLWPVVAGLAWICASFAIGFGYPTLVDSNGAPGAAGPGASGEALDSVAVVKPALPPYYLPDYSSWIGRQWSDIDIASHITIAPDDLDRGPHYLLFYRLDCEHCHELLNVFFTGSLAVPTTVVAIPDKGGFPSEGIRPMPCQECRYAELPPGCEWFFQTPALVRLNNGMVECAAEVDPSTPECLEW